MPSVLDIYLDLREIALSETMFLTTCAVCAKALDDDIEAARQCEPCGTRYCLLLADGRNAC